MSLTTRRDYRTRSARAPLSTRVRSRVEKVDSIRRFVETIVRGSKGARRGQRRERCSHASWQRGLARNRARGSAESGHQSDPFRFD